MKVKIRKPYDGVTHRNQQRRADVFAKWIVIAAASDTKGLKEEGIGYICSNQKLAISCINLMQMGSLRLEKQLKISLSSVKYEVLPEIGDTDEEEESENGSMKSPLRLILCSSTKHMYQQIRNTMGSSVPSWHQLVKSRTNILVFTNCIQDKEEHLMMDDGINMIDATLCNLCGSNEGVEIGSHQMVMILQEIMVIQIQPHPLSNMVPKLMEGATFILINY